VELLVPGRTYIGEIEKEVAIEEAERKNNEGILFSPNITFFDYQRLQFPLRMRNFRPGDRFYPLGAKGSQKLKEFFIDRKIPKFERPRIPLLISGEIIAWIVGYRIDERVKITSETKRMLKIEVNPSTPHLGFAQG
jgi:tRNA(Ile)-lysidine synthase